MNGRTARLINKSVGKNVTYKGNGISVVHKAAGRRTKSFWGRIFAAWERLKEVSPKLAASSPPPKAPTSALVVTSAHTQARKGLKRKWQQQTARERFVTRGVLLRDLSPQT